MLRLKLKDSEPKPVKIKLRANRAQVEGFDAEAPDREDDPLVEEAILLRLLPNIPAVEQLHAAVAKNDFSEVSIKFEERRKAIVTICGESYHAQLLDLPTITEVHKTVDRRNIFKTVSVSQILLVTHNVKSPPPDMSAIARLAPDAQSYPHGITPPLHNVRNRRFQKRMSNKQIESIEAQVEELLRRDAQAKEVQTELLPASAVAAQKAFAEAARAARERAEESDLEVDDELDMEFERAMLAESEETAKDGNAEEPPQAQAHSSSDEEDDDDDDDDDDRQADMEDDDMDEDNARQSGKRLREEIRELLATIEAKERVARTVVNDIMRARHMDAVNRLRAELEKKQRLLSEADERSKVPVQEEEEEEEEDLDDQDDQDEQAEQDEQVEQVEQANQVEQQAAEQPEQQPDETEAQFAGLGERLEDALRDDDDIDSLF